MLRKTALLFSLLLHPLLMPLLGMLILLLANTYVSLLPAEARKIIIFLITTGTLLLPSLMIPISQLGGDIFQPSKEQRNLLLILTFIFYLLTYVLFLRIPVYHFMHNFILGSVISVFIALVVNRKWKISLHMIGLGGITAFLLLAGFKHRLDLFPWFIIAVFASGFAGFSRIYLNLHTPEQVYAGYLAGIASMCLSILIPLPF